MRSQISSSHVMVRRRETFAHDLESFLSCILLIRFCDGDKVVSVELIAPVSPSEEILRRRLTSYLGTSEIQSYVKGFFEKFHQLHYMFI